MTSAELLKRMCEGELPQAYSSKHAWHWFVGRLGEHCGRATATLIRRGLAEATYFRGSEAALNLTEAGRALCAEATSA